MLLLSCILSCKTGDKNAFADGSMQPYDGYPLLESKVEIRQLLKEKCLDTIAFQKGETVADIGAGNGYLEAILAMFHDSLVFYIQDIDATVCNREAVNEVVAFYEKVHGAPFSSSFEVIHGTDSTSNLPDSIFDKILMINTYQYIKQPVEFVMDLKGKLKDEGLLYVINPQTDDYEYLAFLRDAYGWNASPLEQQISDMIGSGFELVRMSRYWSSDTYEHPYLMVFRKEK